MLRRSGSTIESSRMTVGDLVTDALEAPDGQTALAMLRSLAGARQGSTLALVQSHLGDMDGFAVTAAWVR